MEFELYRNNLVPILETREIDIDDVELSPENMAIIEKINTEDERFKTMMRHYEQDIERNTFLIVSQRNENGKYPLLISPRRYKALWLLNSERVRIAVVSRESAQAFYDSVTAVKKAVGDREHFAAIGRRIVDILNVCQIRRDELCDILDMNLVALSRYTSYFYKSTPLEKTFVDEGYIESPNNYERMRSIPRGAQEELLKYARMVKRPLTRTEIDKAKEWYIKQQQSETETAPLADMMQMQTEPAAPKPESLDLETMDIDELENELERAFGDKTDYRRVNLNAKKPEPPQPAVNETPKKPAQPLFVEVPKPVTVVKPLFTENEMMLFLAATGANWRVSGDDLIDAFKAAVIHIAESAPDDLKRKIKRDRVLEEAEKAAMEGRVDPKIILEMIRLMKEQA